MTDQTTDTDVPELWLHQGVAYSRDPVSKRFYQLQPDEWEGVCAGVPDEAVRLVPETAVQTADTAADEDVIKRVSERLVETVRAVVNTSGNLHDEFAEVLRLNLPDLLTAHRAQPDDETIERVRAFLDANDELTNGDRNVIAVIAHGGKFVLYRDDVRALLAAHRAQDQDEKTRVALVEARDALARADAENFLKTPISSDLFAKLDALTVGQAENPQTHTIELREDRWTIMHPLSCRPNLFDCPVNRVAEQQLTERPRVLGRFPCWLADGGQLVIENAALAARPKARQDDERVIHTHDDGSATVTRPGGYILHIGAEETDDA